MTRTTLTIRYRNTAWAFALAMPLHVCEQLDPSGTTLAFAQVMQT